MIDADKRQAIFYLCNQGMGIREIARRFAISTNTVSGIIAQKGILPRGGRKDKIQIDAELLAGLYQQCQGRIQRMHEKLIEEQNITLGYSTLTRMVRALDLGQPHKQRCGKVPDQPGAEMQHDTSPYRLKIGNQHLKVIGSLLYFRYSKIRYLKFYRAFNRFQMKCFFHQALGFLGYAARVCIIDNTSLARLRGSGQNAVIVPEMKQFAGQYSFKFVCHEKGHSNRKAGNERGFWTVETNLFPGRSFQSLEDLNQQAFLWATQRMANRPVGKTRLMPAQAFEYEKPYLIQLPSALPAPYLLHHRDIDQYGYAAFEANYYWVPGSSRHEVSLLQYADQLKIYHGRQLLGEYDLPPQGTKNETFYPRGHRKPAQQPKWRKKSSSYEEKKLRATDNQVDAYLSFVKTQKGIQIHRLIRALYGLSQKLARPLFIQTIKRAYQYRITDMNTIERIAVLQMKDTSQGLPAVSVDENLANRESYLEGYVTDDVDLSLYEKIIDDDHDG
jgi:transposase